PDYTPHYFGVARSWQVVHEMNRVRTQRPAQVARDRLKNLLAQRVARALVIVQNGKDDDLFTLDRIRDSDRGRLTHRWVRHRGRFNLGRPDALSGDLDRVIGAPQDV